MGAPDRGSDGAPDWGSRLGAPDWELQIGARDGNSRWGLQMGSRFGNSRWGESLPVVRRHSYCHNTELASSHPICS